MAGDENLPVAQAAPTVGGVSVDEYWHFRFNKQHTKCWLRRGTIGGLFLLLVLAVTYPQYSDYTERTRTAELLIHLSTAKDPIAERLEADPQARIEFDADRLIPADPGVRTGQGDYATFSYRSISERGVITAFSPQVGTLFVLTPHVENGKVKWTCWASRRVMRDLPSVCRGGNPA